MKLCGFVCAVKDLIWLLFYLSVVSPIHNYCHERFGFITYVFLLVFWDHKEMQALSFIFTSNLNVSAICRRWRYVACMLCGLFIPQTFPFWALNYPLSTLYFPPLTVREHRFLTIIYKHVPRLFSRENCANNHILCISQADWKKNHVYFLLLQYSDIFSVIIKIALWKTPEICRATVIMLLGPLIFINTLGNFWWHMPEWNSFSVTSTLLSIYMHIDT